MLKLCLLVIVWTALPAAAFGQLYLIAGSPTPKYVSAYATVLVVVGADGSVEVNREIVPGKFGTEWTAVSHDGRKALVLSKSPSKGVIVVDFDTASLAKSCQDPDGTGLVGQWLIDSPSRGLMFVGYGTNKLTKKDELLGMIMDPSVPCQSSFVRVDVSELRYITSDGFAGIADTGAGDGLDVYFGSDGSLAKKLLTGEETYFDYKVPTALFNDLKHPAARILINNRQILGLFLYESSNRRLLIFRKSDSTWQQLAEPSPGRAFGSFIASSESHLKNATFTESAGKLEWRQKEAPTGPPIAGSLKDARLIYPGILHLYDAATEKSYTITTAQGDSEVLLVENGLVYYRVSNRLYSAAIAGTSIGAPKLLATDELIRDAHWAFIK